MLGFMAITGIFGLHNLQGLDIKIIPPDEIYRSLPAQLTVQITSRHKFLPYCLLQLRIEEAELQIPLLKPRETVARKMLITFPKRGPASISNVIVLSQFPVNFFVRSNVIPVVADYLVFPRPEPMPSELAAGSAAKRGDAFSRHKGGGGEMEAIAAYTGQEPLKLVHWRLSARHGELLVKEMGAEAGVPVIINPDELPGKLEDRLSHAVFLINRLMAGGKAVGLKLSDRQIPPGVSRQHRLKLLGELAHHAAD
jgi:uncharacterized protein (DUF58 family)